MRHLKDTVKLSRNSGERKSLFKNMVTALFRYERITTTKTKAKVLRRIAEKVITKAKKGKESSWRNIFSDIQDKKVVKKLFDVLAPRYNLRKGGYTRILKLGLRAGDCAPLVLIELVDRPEKISVKKEKKKKEEIKS